MDSALADHLAPLVEDEEDSDADLVAQEEPCEVEDLLCSREAAAQGKKRNRLGEVLRIKARNTVTVGLRLLQMVFSLRQHFAGAASVGLALDASCVGGLNRMLGFITDPSGVGAWLAPQVL